MTALAARPAHMTPAEFLAWEAGQEDRHEFVDGQPRLMAGGTRAHHRIAENISFALRTRLRGGPCFAMREQKVFTPQGNYRYPDVVVDCGQAQRPGDLAAEAPRVVFEVESPSTSDLDAIDRFEDYQSIPAVAAIVFVSQSKAYARIYRREGERWRSEEAAGLDAALPLEALGCTLPLADVYEGLEAVLAGS
jgi:Uma2 family endonuclease